MKKETKYTTARQCALKDIAEEVKELAYDKGKEIDSNLWSWIISSYFVSSTTLNTKENRRLNRELGLHKVNYIYRYQKNQTDEN